MMRHSRRWLRTYDYCVIIIYHSALFCVFYWSSAPDEDARVAVFVLNELV